MSDIVFKCPSCSKNLCAGDNAVGMSFSCPTCQGKIAVPESDFAFNCPHCDCNLLTVEGMMGEQFECPSCGNEFLIPAVDKKLAQPSEPRTVNVTCQTCSSVLEIEDSQMKGGMVVCPKCSRTIFIPSSSFGGPSVTSLPQPASRKCPVCNTDMPEKAVICVGCGLDLRTGNKLSLEPDAQKKKLTFKKTTDFQAEPPPNSILDRYPMPQYKQPTLLERVMPVLKSVMYLVVITISIAALIYFVDVSALWKKVVGLVRRTPAQEVVDDKSPKASQAFEKSDTKSKVAGKIARADTKNADEIVSVLEKLKGKPGDNAILQELMDCIRVTTESGDNRLVKGGMKAIFSLAQLGYSVEDIGLAGCEHVIKNYPETEFASMVNKANFYNPCPKCANSGQVRDVCSTCSGALTCRTCGGDGAVQTTQEVKQQGLATRRASIDSSFHHRHYYWYGHYHTGKSSAPPRRMGEPLASTEKKTVSVACNSCAGTGNCRTCKGAGYVGAKCSGCDSTGKLLSKEKAAVQCNAAITKTLSLLQQRQTQGKDIEFLQKDQLNDGEANADASSTNEVAALPVQKK